MPVQEAVRTAILSELDRIEKTYHIRILLAVESGSRAWGFPSGDSDYDVRFIYIRPRSDYLSIAVIKDTLNFALKDDLDICGWDIKKVLRHLLKSNATLFEWFQSPVVYRQVEGFIRDLRLLADDYFSPRAVLRHYTGIFKNFYATLTPGKDPVKLKKLFYVLRPLLAAQWVLVKGTVPPVEFRGLLDLIRDRPRIIQIVESLLEQKAGRKGENSTVIVNPQLMTFIDECKQACLGQLDRFPRSESDLTALNSYFIRLLDNPGTG